VADRNLNVEEEMRSYTVGRTTEALEAVTGNYRSSNVY
jgi:hypothetical protein